MSSHQTSVFVRLALAFLLILHIASTASAQSLTEKLKQEDVSQLSKSAREKGNAARGAVLFAEQRLGCANCHATGRNDLLGPDLSRLGDDVKDASLIEAVLQPSKTIRKGFETTTLVLENGRSISGRIMQESAEELTLRDTSPKRKLQRIRINDIDQRKVDRVSGMPTKLADQLKGRQQFLDLLSYVMSVVDAGPTVQVMNQRGGETISAELHGIVLLNEFQCAACHEYTVPATELSPATAPNLKWMAGRINPSYLEEFLTQPHGQKPSTRMPDLLAELSDDDRAQTAQALTQFIVSLNDKDFAANNRPTDIGAAERGRELFHSVGCVACHAPRDGDRPKPTDDSVPLGPIAGKYSLETLIEFLADPHSVRPSGRMPNLTLTHWETIDVAHFLLASDGDSSKAIDSKPFQRDGNLAAVGQKQFHSLGCSACHSVYAEPISNQKRTHIRADRLERGCLSEQTGRWPKFAMKETDRRAIRTALKGSAAKISNSQQIAANLTALRCLNCHTRDNLGGISDERNPWFRTTNPNLGPQGRIPPTLTGVGAKLKPTWMRQVLVRGRSIRPYVKTRMPQYGVDNVAHLVDLFQEADQQPALSEIKFSVPKKEMRNAGHELAGTGGLNCIVCHTFQLKPAATMPAVDLTDMSERLQADWFRRYMQNPQSLSPNTVMPSFWPGGKAIRKDVLKGDPDQQVAALWEWLLDGRQARVPRGLIRKPMELLATDEAVMLRRSYQGIGKRGIGVGYPLQVNLAFDAEQLRLAMIWKGRFLDPGGVWRSQGHGTARPLTRPLQFVKGPDVQLADRRWKEADDRPATHRFKGYSLDEKRRPKFAYEINGIAVEDFFTDVRDEKTQQLVLRRLLTIQSTAGEALVFRAASGKSIQQQTDNVFLVDDKLRVRLERPASSKATIVDSANGQQLEITLTARGQQQIIVDYQW